MPFDILGYRDKYKGYYGNMPLEDVAKDVYQRGYKDQYPDYDTWKRDKGIDQAIAGENRQPTFDDKFRAATDNVAPKESSSILRRAIGDPSASLAKGAIIGIPEAIIGLADIPTMGYAGKGFTKLMRGRTFQDSRESFDAQFLSPEAIEAQEKVSQAKGFTETIKTAVQNPSSIVSTIMESAPSMVGGAAIGRMAMKGIGKAVIAKGITEAEKISRAIAAGAVGEGLISAGQNTEQLRQGIESGTLSPAQVAATAGSGFVTGLISRMSAGLAKRLGIVDVDTLLAGANTGKVFDSAKTVLKGIIGSAITEGALEELPQSAQEQMAQNIATGKPILDGVAEAAAMGLLSGAGMGMMGAGSVALTQKREPKTYDDAVNKLRNAAYIMDVLDSGLKTGEFNGKPFTDKNAVELINESIKTGIYTEDYIDRFKDKYPQLRDGLNGLIADNITKKIDEAVTKEPTKPLTNTMRNLSDVPDFEEPVNPEVKKLQDRITKTEDFLNRNANRKGENRYNDYVARLEADKSKLSELTGGDQNGTLQTETEVENVSPTAPAAGTATPEVQTWFRGIDQVNKETGDHFFSGDESVAGDFGKVSKLEATEMPKNPLVVGSKEDLVEAIGYKHDPMAEPKDIPKEERFDILAKKYAQAKGHDAIVYQNGTMEAPELHVFGKEETPPAPLSQTDAATVGAKEVKAGGALNNQALIEEAKKYKTVDEFVQKTHGRFVANADKLTPEEKELSDAFYKSDKEAVWNKAQEVSAPAAGQAAGEGKQPHEMSRADYVRAGGLKMKGRAAEHKKAVQQAITEGKITEHPDYPELQKKETDTFGDIPKVQKEQWGKYPDKQLKEFADKGIPGAEIEIAKRAKKAEANEPKEIFIRAAEKKDLGRVQKSLKAIPDKFGYEKVYKRGGGKTLRGFYYVKVKVKEVKSEKPAPKVSGAENLVTFLQRAGKVRLGEEFQDKTGDAWSRAHGFRSKDRSREMGDIASVTSQNGKMAMDEAASFVNAEGFRDKNGSKFTDRTLFETLSNGEGRNILHPDKAESIIDREIEKKAREHAEREEAAYYDRINEAIPEVVAGESEANRGETLAYLEGKADEEGYNPEEAYAEINSFLDDVTKAQYLEQERRVNFPHRKKVSEMTPEERAIALLTDHLTGLKNKRAYEEAQRLPFQTSIDIDGLKYINDTYGHDAGNDLLKKVGEALNRASEGELVYHLHGDEFAIETKTPEISQIIIDETKKILEAEPLEFNGEKYVADFSYGIAETTEGDKPLLDADKAMMANKTERRVERGKKTPEEIKTENTKAGKQSWEQTRDEYVGDKTGDAMAVALSAHALHVKQAVADGEKVPLNVLNNYKSNGWAQIAIDKIKSKGDVQTTIPGASAAETFSLTAKEPETPVVKGAKLTPQNLQPKEKNADIFAEEAEAKDIVEDITLKRDTDIYTMDGLKERLASINRQFEKEVNSGTRSHSVADSRKKDARIAKLNERKEVIRQRMRDLRDGKLVAPDKKPPKPAKPTVAERHAEKENKDREYYDSSPAKSFIESTLPDVNIYNKTALARYLDGNINEYNGLVDRKWIAALESLNAPDSLKTADATRKEIAGFIKEKYQEANAEIKEWQDIPELDAQIRTIEEPTKDFNKWTVEIGAQESLGERGGDILTQFYKEKPTLDEIKQDILDHYKKEKIEINKELVAGIVAKSGRDEIREEAIDKVLANKQIPKSQDEINKEIVASLQEVADKITEVYKVPKIAVQITTAKGKGAASYNTWRVRGGKINNAKNITIYNYKEIADHKGEIIEKLSHELAHHIQNNQKGSLKHSDSMLDMADDLGIFISKNYMGLIRTEKEVAGETPKQPFEMTLDEYLKEASDSYGEGTEESDNAVKRFHKDHILGALSSGQLTPAKYKELHESTYGKLEEFAGKTNTEDSGVELTYNKRNRIKTGIKWDDIKDKNTALKVKETNKNNVYPKPDYQVMVDEGMEPMIAHIVKQIYDSISNTPLTRGTLTDADMERYIAAVNRVMDGVLKWANDKGAIATWAGKQARYAGAALGKVTNLTDLAQSNKSLLDMVYPEGYKTYLEEVRILGGNKLLKALQPGYDQCRRALTDIKKGWPGKLESWQKQGYAIIEKKDVKIEDGYRDVKDNQVFYVQIDGRTYGDRFNTREEAQAAIDNLKPFILVDKYHRPIGQFDTIAEAQEAAREKVKRENKPTINEKGISVQAAARTGEQRREPGENITTDRLREAFGFKGVNFGNWMKGNTNEAERQLHLNHAYDSFMDLAEILNVPPEAISLNGFLGVAIGAQGSGAHAAHFVPGVNEINLTRTAGAGAMAHEWAHALDHYFANQAGLESGKVPYLTEHAALSATRTVMEKQDDGTWKKVTKTAFSENIRPEIVELFKKIVHTMNKKTINITPEEQAEQIAARKEDSRKQIDSWLRTIKEDFIRNKVAAEDFDRLADRIKKLDLGEGKIAVSGGFSMSPVVAKLRNLYKEKAGRVYSLDQIKGLQSNIDHYKYLSEKENEEHIPQTREVGTDYGTESAKADKGKSKACWSTKREMFARAFDAFVTDTIEEKAAINTYLSGLEAIPPKGEERKTINQAFRDLIQKIKTRETDKGVEMYSVGTPTPYQMPTIADVQDVFKGQEVSEINGGFLIKTHAGEVFVESVNSIDANTAALNIGYSKGKLSEKEVIAGKYDKGVISLVKGAADKFTLSHESVHYMEDIGVISPSETSLLKRHIQNLVSDGKFETVNEKDIGGAEDRANFLADALTRPPKGLLGRILNKIHDFIDKLVNAFGIRTIRGITRDVETGNIYSRETEVQRETRLDLEGGQYQLRKQTDPPISKDPKVLNLYLKDETDAIVQTITNKFHPKSMTWLETMLKSPEWFDHPQIQNIVKLFMRDRNELYHETFNELNAFNDSTVAEAAKALRNKGLSLTERLSGKVSPEYQTLMDMIDDGDTRWVRNKKIPLATQLKHFEDAWRKKGATDEIINVWRSFRQSYDKALDLMTKQLRDMIEEIKQKAKAKGESPDFAELNQTLKGALAQMEEWRGFYAPRQRRGNWAVQAYKEHGPLEQNREWYRAHHVSELSAQREAKKLERDGWKIYKVGETEKLPESVYQDVRAVSTAKLIDAALDKLGKKIDLDQMATFNAEILREVSDMIKSRGFRSTMIHRGRGNVVRGFIEDPIERHLMYINSVSGGISKARVARMAMQELLGDKEMGEPGIDPVKEPKAFSVAQDYIQEQLRNADASDRIIGLAKSIATFKFLGFNLRSLAVNTTAIVTTAPASIHQYAMGGKGSFVEIYRQLAKAGKDYGAAMAGKDLGNPDEAAFIADVHKKGWDDAQYTREALGEISKIHSRVWSTMMDASMYLFGVSEKWNRGTTMLAAYRLARKNGMSHDQAAETAKTSSDKAHGVYGKSTMPMWAQGTNPAAKLGQMMYVYSKFGHNYLQMLYDMGFKKKNIKGAMFAFLSPLVLAGGAAFPFKDAIFGFAGFILGLLGFDRDPEKWVWDQIREHLGGDAEKFGRHGLTGAMGVDISGSLSIGVGIPKNFIDLTGAIGGVATEITEAGASLANREPGRAAEHLLPTGLANPLRAMRESKEGATTRNRRRVWDEKGKPYVPGTGASIARGFGFRSTEQAVLSERTWEGHREQGKISDRRNSIYERYRAWMLGGRDRDEYKKIVKEVQDFNRFIRENRLRGESYITSQSLKNQARRMMRPSKKERSILKN